MNLLMWLAWSLFEQLSLYCTTGSNCTAPTKPGVLNSNSVLEMVSTFSRSSWYLNMSTVASSTVLFNR
jgi:hypothetical protein